MNLCTGLIMATETNILKTVSIVMTLMTPKVPSFDTKMSPFSG